MGLLRETIDRRVLPAVGVYIGASWVVVEILDRLVERYYLSPYLTDIVFWALFLVLPSVVLLTWTHGRPGKDRVSRLEKIFVPLNVVLVAGWLFTVFGDKDMSATADMITMANELGEDEVHVVPRESYRRRAFLYFMDSEDETEDLRWLQYSVTELLAQDLGQNPFLLVNSPWEGFFPEIEEAGFDSGLGLPVSLKSRIADEANRDFFIDGVADRRDGQFTLTVRVWKTASMELVGESTVSGWNLPGLVDELSDDVREILDTPPGGESLPLSEAFGESEEALKHYVAARNAVLLDNDREEANRLYDLALNEDPDFALAWFMKSRSLWEQGNGAGAMATLEQAQKRAYRLSERNQTNVKLMMYGISGENDKVETLLRMRTRIIGDASSFATLANFLMLTGEPEEAKIHFERQMELDSSAIGTLLQLANIERSTGNMEAAIAYVEEYIAQRPEDFDSLMMLGDLHIESGDFELARSYYEQAQILEDPPLASTLELATLAIRKGEWARVTRLLKEAESVTITPRHVIQFLLVERTFEFRLGRIERVLEVTEKLGEYTLQELTPLEHVIAKHVALVQANLLIGRVEPAEAALAAAHELLQFPMNGFLAHSEAQIAIHTGDFERAESALAELDAFIERFKADYLAFMASVGAAQLAEATGEYSEAGKLFSEALEGIRSSAYAGAFQDGQPELYGMCAQAHVRAGEFEQAQKAIDEGFRRDAAEPALWMGRALLQEAQGLPQMARASVNYALAIWSDADADYVPYQEAVELAQRLSKAVER